MKFDCKIRINDRQRTNGSSTLKAAKGVIGLAKSTSNEWALIVRLFKDTTATQYKVDNAEHNHSSLGFSSRKMFKVSFIDAFKMEWPPFNSVNHRTMSNYQRRTWNR